MTSPPPHTFILPPPHFFKVIMHSTIEDRKLSIPKKFAAEYGKFLSSSICLKLPDGLEWNIGLTTATNGTVWLENGWHQFSEHYRLRLGSFLVFRFDGSSTFHTIVLDITGSEIAYDSNHNVNASQDDLQNEYGNFNIETLEPNASVPRPPKKMKKEGLLSPKIEPEEEERKPKERASRKRTRPSSSPSKKVDEAERKYSNLKEFEKTGFKVVMGKSFVEGRYNMTIPKDFAKKYLKEAFGSIRILNSEGRSWPMVYKWGQSHKIGYAYISSGWKCFAQENHLKEGHIGFFQMIKKDLLLFTLEGICPPPIPPKRNVANSSTKNPSFKVKIRTKSYKSAVLNIPFTFADNHLSPTTNTAKLVVGSKQWKVRIKQYEKCFRLSAGWSTFFWQNCLEDGDNCLFELVQKSEFQCVFQVNIFKKP